MLCITELSDPEKAKIFDENTKILKLSFEFNEFHRLFEGVTESVQNNLHRYNAFKL